jgi:hypothetical protein
MLRKSSIERSSLGARRERMRVHVMIACLVSTRIAAASVPRISDQQLTPSRNHSADLDNPKPGIHQHRSTSTTSVYCVLHSQTELDHGLPGTALTTRLDIHAQLLTYRRTAQAPNSAAVASRRSRPPTPTAASVSASLRSRPSTSTRTPTSSRTTSAASSAACV